MEDDKVKENEDTTSYSDQMDLLALARHKFDEIRRENRALSREETHKQSHRLGSSSSSLGVLKDGVDSRETGDQNPRIAKNVLSTLLYLSLMMNKVEDMKILLKKTDKKAYNEWKTIFDVMHTPLFHMHERNVQNLRAKVIYERKKQYKNQLMNVNQVLEQKSKEVEDIQAHSNIIAKNMSEALKKSIDEHSKVNKELISKHGLELDLTKAQEEIKMLREHLKASTEELRKIKDDNVPSLEKNLIEREKKISSGLKEIEFLKAETQRYEKINEKLNMEIIDLRENKESLHSELVGNMKEKELAIQKMNEEKTNRQVNLGKLNSELKITNDKLQLSDLSLEKTKSELLESNETHANNIQIIHEELTEEKKSVAALSNELRLTKKSFDELRLTAEAEKKKYEKVGENMMKERESGIRNKSKLMEIIQSKDVRLMDLQSKLKQANDSLCNARTEHKIASARYMNENKELKETTSKLESSILIAEKSEKQRLETLYNNTAFMMTDVKQETRNSFSSCQKQNQCMKDSITTLENETKKMSSDMKNVHDQLHALERFCDRSQVYQSEEKIARFEIQESLINNQSLAKETSIVMAKLLMRVEKLDAFFCKAKGTKDMIRDCREQQESNDIQTSLKEKDDLTRSGASNTNVPAETTQESAMDTPETKEKEMIFIEKHCDIMSIQDENKEKNIEEEKSKDISHNHQEEHVKHECGQRDQYGENHVECIYSEESNNKPNVNESIMNRELTVVSNVKETPLIFTSAVELDCTNNLIDKQENKDILLLDSACESVQKECDKGDADFGSEKEDISILPIENEVNMNKCNEKEVGKTKEIASGIQQPHLHQSSTLLKNMASTVVDDIMKQVIAGMISLVV